VKRVTSVFFERTDIPIKKRIFDESVYADLAKSSFDVWKYTEEDLIHFMGQMFVTMGLVEHFSIDENLLRNFLMTVRNLYNKNPFHNFKHAFCVTQMVF
jgi:high affinity cGMP-specific 3',5'-cyclic phosphodiesterase 9